MKTPIRGVCHCRITILQHQLPTFAAIVATIVAFHLKERPSCHCPPKVDFFHGSIYHQSVHAIYHQRKPSPINEAHH